MRQAWDQLRALIWKDLALELRTKDMLSAMLIFSFLVMVVFAFALRPEAATTRAVFPGILWVDFSFAGLLGLNRAFAHERANDCLTGLLLAPLDPVLIYAAKVISNFLFLALVEAISLPLFFAFFNYPWSGAAAALLAILFLGTLGFAAVGTFLAALAANTRTGEVLLPLILFPVLVPVLLAAVQGTALALAGQTGPALAAWLRLLAVYDIIFCVLAALLFPYLLEP